MKVVKKFYVNFDVEQFQQSFDPSRLLLESYNSSSLHSFI